MTSIETTKDSNKSESAIWALGFRPFFLLGCAIGVLSLFLWLQSYAGQFPAKHIGIFWHAHEMIHGFATAIIIGFLYTASQNWTGIRGIHGPYLILVTAIWLAGRLVFLVPGLNLAFVAVVDLMFLPIASGFLASYLMRQNQSRNLIFIAFLAMLWLSNFGYHLDVLGLWPGVSQKWLYFAVHIIIAVILLVTSRVIPFFTERAIAGYKRHNFPKLDIGLIACSIIFAFFHLWFGLSLPTAVVAGVGALLALLRFGLWYHHSIWRVPILSILYLGYLWVVIGFGLSALAFWGFLAPSTAIHAFTAGAISTLIIGMISRVSLGHTGRVIKASNWIVLAYAFIVVGAMVRVFGVLLLPGNYFYLMMTSGILWVSGFIIFIIVYAPILWRPRIDGKAG